MKSFQSTFLTALIAVCGVLSANARSTDRTTLWLNSDVTSHVVMPENLVMVDISTAKIIGNQCTDNMLRLKPAPADSIAESFHENQFLGTITLIGERHIAQYDVRYKSNPEYATNLYRVSYDDTQAYSNPDVSMPESEMARFAWKIYGSKRKFNNINSKKNGIKASVYNIYSVGNYFFIDFGLENRTNIPYDIAELRVSLTDKKETKATNSQTIELTPVFLLNPAKSFSKNYRQVMVLNKLTFPEEKVLNIALSENQISGRVANLTLEYEDVLNADGFDMSKSDKDVVYLTNYSGQANPGHGKSNGKLGKQNVQLSEDLKKANTEIRSLKGENAQLKLSLEKLQTAYDGANETIKKLLSKSK